MLNFKKLLISDIDTLRPYFEKDKSFICDRTVGSSVMWRDFCDTHYAFYGDDVIFDVKYLNGLRSFCFLNYANAGNIIEEIFRYADMLNRRVDLCTVGENELFELKKLYYTEEFTDSAWSDYVYSAKAISSLSGKKYNGQRNHINKFKKMYSDYNFEKLDESNVDEVVSFCKNFKIKSDNITPMALEEGRKTVEMVENYKAYNFLTAVLRINRKVEGFCAGEKKGNTLFVHIEKANSSFNGIYPMLTNMFINKYADECEYVNREEDDGEEGLRYSKMSYHPMFKVEKYFVSVRRKGV